MADEWDPDGVLGADLFAALHARTLDIERVRALAVLAYRRSIGDGDISPERAGEAQAAGRWLVELAARPEYTFSARPLDAYVARRRVALYPTLGDKIGTVSQRSCAICDAYAPAGPGPWTLTLRMQPRSFQAVPYAEFAAALRVAVSARLSAHDFSPIRDQRICLSMTVVLSNRRKIDVDNIAKLTLDALAGTLFTDDSQVDHLDVVKLFSDDQDEEFITLMLRPSRLNQHRDVLDLRRFLTLEYVAVIDVPAPLPQ